MGDHHVARQLVPRPACRAATQSGAGLLGGLGRACYRRRWITLLAWIIGVACLITLWQQFGAAALNSFNSSDPGQTVLNQHFPRASGDTLTLAIKSTAPVTSPAVRAQVASALVPFERAAHVTSVSDPYATPGQVSRDGHVAFSTVQFGIAGSSISNGEATALMNDARAASGHGVTFSLGGNVVDQEETPYGGPTNGVGVIAAAVILLIAFGSLLAMGLPIATAVLGIGAGLSLIGLLGHVFPAPSFSPIIAGLIGLGVGIDYALFIVTRFRESLRAGTAPEAAAVTAMRTAGRSVLVAGITVVIGMLGLLILRQSLLNGVAVAAAATVAMVLLASLTLLPALLGFSGTRLAKPSRSQAPGVDAWNTHPFGRTEVASRRAVGRGHPAPPGDRRRRVRCLHSAACRAGARHEAELPRRVGAGARHHGVRELRDDGAGVRPRVQRAGDHRRDVARPARQH